MFPQTQAGGGVQTGPKAAKETWEEAQKPPDSMAFSVTALAPWGSPFRTKVHSDGVIGVGTVRLSLSVAKMLASSRHSTGDSLLPLGSAQKYLNIGILKVQNY